MGEEVFFGGVYNWRAMRALEYRRTLGLAFRAAAAEAVGEGDSEGQLARLLAEEPAERHIQPPRDRRHGDYACAVAFQLAPLLRRSPPQIAEDILRRFSPPDFVADTSAVGGYINVRIKSASKTEVVADILRDPKNYGRGQNNNQTALLEFVSANPTGPLHIGHGRAAAFGDSLANLMQFAGYEVRREYYINDAGRQADILAASAWLRHTPPPDDSPMPAGMYRGDYLRAVAALPSVQKHLAPSSPPDWNSLSPKLQNKTDDEIADILVAAMRDSFSDKKKADAFVDAVADAGLQLIKNDLDALGVAPFDQWFSERTLHRENKLTAAVEILKKNNAENLYEKDGALWFRSSAHGDDKDRVLRRADGRWTYFAADVAYHSDKLSRPLERGRNLLLINVLGADHHGYIARLRAVVAALADSDSPRKENFKPPVLETLLIQFVALVKSGMRTKMSTRAGEFLALSSLVSEIGRDPARYFYVMRKNDQHLDFDLELAKEKSEKNPVYYLQYAHARAASVFRKWQDDFGGDIKTLAAADPAPLADNPSAARLCDSLADFPDAIQHAAHSRAAHFFANYLQELAAALHCYYDQTRMLTSKDDSETPARLALLLAAKNVLASGLNLLGVDAPETM